MHRGKIKEYPLWSLWSFYSRSMTFHPVWADGLVLLMMILRCTDSQSVMMILGKHQQLLTVQRACCCYCCAVLVCLLNRVWCWTAGGDGCIGSPHPMHTIAQPAACQPSCLAPCCPDTPSWNWLGFPSGGLCYVCTLTPDNLGLTPFRHQCLSFQTLKSITTPVMSVYCGTFIHLYFSHINILQ